MFRKPWAIHTLRYTDWAGRPIYYCRVRWFLSRNEAEWPAEQLWTAAFLATKPIHAFSSKRRGGGYKISANI